MQISVTCRHMESSDAVRDYAHERVERSLDGFPRVQNVRVILEVEKYRHIAEVIVHGKNRIDVEAREQSDDMYVSIDGAVDKAARQLRRLRDKVQDHKSQGKMAEIDLAQGIPEDDLETNDL